MTLKTFARGFILTLWAGSSAVMAAQSGPFIYDPATETTVTGTILHVATFRSPDGEVGVHFDLKGPNGMINVHVAPAMYIGMSNFSFLADDQIEVTGMTSFLDGNKSFVARVIKKEDGKALTLRGKDGKPLWTSGAEGADGCGVEHPALPRGTEL
jgi:hypothetical protein